MKNYNELKEKIMQECVDKISDEIIEKTEWKDVRVSPLGPVITAEEIKSDFKKTMGTLLFDIKGIDRAKKGIKIIEENIGSTPNEKQCREELQQAGNLLFERLVHYANQEPGTKLFGEQDKNTLAATLGFSAETMASFYEIGTHLLKEKKYEDAASVFQFLSNLNPYRYEIWVSLGLAHQQLGDFFSAIHCFSMASLMNPEEPQPYISSAECYMAKRDYENAKGSLILAEHFLSSGNREIYEPRINELMHSL